MAGEMLHHKLQKHIFVSSTNETVCLGIITFFTVLKTHSIRWKIHIWFSEYNFIWYYIKYISMTFFK